MSHYACVTLRAHQSFPAVVIYTWHSYNLIYNHHIQVKLRFGILKSNWQYHPNSSKKKKKKKKFINITWTCHCKVFPSGKRYNICLAIWKETFKNMTLWFCHIKILIMACDNIDIFNIFLIHIFDVQTTNYLIFLSRNISL